MALSYARSGRFKPTDFTVLPSGDVIVLERRFIPPFNIAARLRIILARAIGRGGTLDGRETARLVGPFTADDMEGTALIYLVSDDNFNPPQNTIPPMLCLGP